MSKKKNKIIAIFIALFVLIGCFFIFNSMNTKNSNKSLEGKIEAVSGLPSDYKSFKIQINGKLYNMPLSVEKIEKLGFSPVISYDDSQISSNTLTTDTYEYFSSTQKSKIEVGFYNPTNDTLKVKDCKISAILVKQEQVNDDSAEIVFPGGVQIGSTFKKVQNAYGEYDETYKGEKYNVYTWKSTEQNLVKIYIDKTTQRVIEIYMQKT